MCRSSIGEPTRECGRSAPCGGHDEAIQRFHAFATRVNSRAVGAGSVVKVTEDGCGDGSVGQMRDDVADP